jgi:hypothetical protein
MRGGRIPESGEGGKGSWRQVVVQFGSDDASDGVKAVRAKGGFRAVGGYKDVP